jgi:hypothetical protein
LDIRTTQRGPLAEKLEPPERRRQQVPAKMDRKPDERPKQTGDKGAAILPRSAARALACRNYCRLSGPNRARLRHGLLARSSRLRIDGRRPRRRQEVTDPRSSHCSSHYGSPMAEPWTRQRHRSKWERRPSSCVHDRIQRSCPISIWREAQRQNDGATPTHCAGSGRRFARCKSHFLADRGKRVADPVADFG